MWGQDIHHWIYVGVEKVMISQGLVEARIYVTLAFAFLVFIGLSAIIAIAVQSAFYSPPAPLKPQLGREDLPISSRLGVFSPLYLLPVAPILLALTLELNCLKPLKRNVIPKKGAFIAITMLGYIFGAILTGILLTIAYQKIYKK